MTINFLTLFRVASNFFLMFADIGLSTKYLIHILAGNPKYLLTFYSQLIFLLFLMDYPIDWHKQN